MKRYPGAQPFSTEQKNVFFGREQELDTLYRIVSSEQMVLLFAKSGMGKSSLLNAGLIARVRGAGRYKPVSIRFGAYMEGIDATPLERAKEQLDENRNHEKDRGKHFLDKIKPKGEDSLWYHLKRMMTEGIPGASTAQSERPAGILIVLDQFEELFTYPETEMAAFGRQLSELLFTNIPDRFRQKLETGLVTDPEFLNEQELRELHRPLDIRVVMAIRSDRMSLLNKLTPSLPNILEYCYELKSLNRQQAESAILSPAYLAEAPAGEFFDSPVFDFEDEAVETLLDFLSDGGTQEIESFQLQILCEYAERAVVLRQKRLLVTAADFADPNVILENYYLDKIAELPENERLPARRLVEEGLIFEEEERRLSLYEGQITRTYGANESLLRRLLDTHLIRSEPSLRGGYTYELSHDTLVAPVLKAKSKRLDIERAEAEAAENLRREQEMAELKRKAEEERHLRENAERGERLARQRTRLALAVMVVALAAGIYAFVQKQAADRARNLAEQKEQKVQQELAGRKAAEVQLLLQRFEKIDSTERETRRKVLEEALKVDSANAEVRRRLDNL